MNTRDWTDTWQTLCERCHWGDPTYELNDQLLTEILMKIYYNNNKGLFVKKENWQANLDRELTKTLLLGCYTPSGVMYAVKGSPPKGSIYIPDVDRGDIFYFERGKMKRLGKAIKYMYLKSVFYKDAKRIIHEWNRDNALPKEKRGDLTYYKTADELIENLSLK